MWYITPSRVWDIDGLAFLSLSYHFSLDLLSKTAKRDDEELEDITDAGVSMRVASRVKELIKVARPELDRL